MSYVSFHFTFTLYFLRIPFLSWHITGMPEFMWHVGKCICSWADYAKYLGRIGPANILDKVQTRKRASLALERAHLAACLAVEHVLLRGQPIRISIVLQLRL